MVINVWMINRQMFFLSLMTIHFRESDAVAPHRCWFHSAQIMSGPSFSSGSVGGSVSSSVVPATTFL